MNLILLVITVVVFYKNWGWIKKNVGIALILGAVAYLLAMFVVPWAWELSLPARDAGIRLIHAEADDHELARVAQSKPPIDQTVGGDDNAFAEKLLAFGSEDGARRNVRYAAEARARGKVPRTPELKVWGRQDDWQGFDIPVYEPIRIQASGQIRSGLISFEIYGPDGMYEHGLPMVHQNGKYTVIPINVVPFGALIGRVCRSSGACGQPFFIGSDGVACPAIHGSGDLQLWTNGFVGQGRYPSREYFQNNYGGFNFKATTQGAAAKCLALAASQ